MASSPSQILAYKNDPDKFKNRTREWRKKHGNLVREREREYRLLRRYGITMEQRDALIESQDGKCALCDCVLTDLRLPSPSGHNYPCIDHDHKTGKVRGILCVGCNRALGRLGDSVDSIQKVLNYLEAQS